MRPTKQTILHDPANGQHGNCLSAVLAALLHLPISEVPLFINPESWVKDLNAWLRPMGLAYCLVEDFDCHIAAYGIEGLWHEVSGNTSRSADVIHACVAKDGDPVFDPHPDNTGLTNVTCYGFFISLEPWRLRKDAERYRWLREQSWDAGELCIVSQPKHAVKLGHDCPSLFRLDAAIDAAIAQGK